MEHFEKEDNIFDIVALAESNLKREIKNDKKKRNSQLLVLSESDKSKSSNFGSTTLSSIGYGSTTGMNSSDSISSKSYMKLEELEMPLSFCSMASCEDLVHVTDISSPMDQSGKDSLASVMEEKRMDSSIQHQTSKPSISMSEHGSLFTDCQRILDALDISPESGSSCNSRMTIFADSDCNHEKKSVNWSLPTREILRSIGRPIVGPIDLALNVAPILVAHAAVGWICASGGLYTLMAPVSRSGYALDGCCRPQFQKPKPSVPQDQDTAVASLTGKQKRPWPTHPTSEPSNSSELGSSLFTDCEKILGLLEISPEAESSANNKRMTVFDLDNLNDSELFGTPRSRFKSEGREMMSTPKTALEKALNMYPDFDEDLLGLREQHPHQEADAFDLEEKENTDHPSTKEAQSCLHKPSNSKRKENPVLKSTYDPKNPFSNSTSDAKERKDSQTLDKKRKVNLTFDSQNPPKTISSPEKKVANSTFDGKQPSKLGSSPEKIVLNSTFDKKLPSKLGSSPENIVLNSTFDKKLPSKLGSSPKKKLLNSTFDKKLPSKLGSNPENIVLNSTFDSKPSKPGSSPEKRALNSTFDSPSKPKSSPKKKPLNSTFDSKPPPKPGSSPEKKALNSTFDSKPPPKPGSSPEKKALNSTFDSKPPPKPGSSPEKKNLNSTFELKPKKLNTTFDCDDENDHNRTFELVGKGCFLIDGNAQTLMDLESKDLHNVLRLTPMKDPPAEGAHQPNTRTPTTTGTPTTSGVFQKPMDWKKTSVLRQLSLVGLEPRVIFGKDNIPTDQSVVQNPPTKGKHSEEDFPRVESHYNKENRGKEEGQIRLRKRTGAVPLGGNGPMKAIPLKMATEVLKRAASTPITAAHGGETSEQTDSGGSSKSGGFPPSFPSLSSVSSIETEYGNRFDFAGSGSSTPEVFRRREKVEGPRITSTPTFGHNLKFKSDLGLGLSPTPIPTPASGDRDNLKDMDGYPYYLCSPDRLDFSPDSR